MTTLTLQRRAYTDFEQARRRAVWHDWLNWFLRKSNELISFDALLKSLQITRQYDRGIQIVPVAEIVGSQGRYRDFDRSFFPRQSHTRERWVSVNQAHYKQIELPPVELFKIGQTYFVIDGHHRISVARIHGQEFIDAHVTEIETRAPVWSQAFCSRPKNGRIEASCHP